MSVQVCSDYNTGKRQTVWMQILDSDKDRHLLERQQYWSDIQARTKEKDGVYQKDDLKLFKHAHCEGNSVPDYNLGVFYMIIYICCFFILTSLQLNQWSV